MPQPLPPNAVELVDALVDSLRDARMAQGLRCPWCKSDDVRGHGTFKGKSFTVRHRYRCCNDECNHQTFSDLTLTPAWRAKKVWLWKDYIRCMAEGLSIRQTAARLGIHVSTAFRIRHAILDWLREQDNEKLLGWTEVSTIPFTYSEKGQQRSKKIEAFRKAFWRGKRRPRVVHVAMALDRLGHVITRRLGPDLLLARELVDAFRSRVSWASFTGRAGPYSPIARFAKLMGAPYLQADVKGRGKADLLTHMRQSDDYMRRLHVWLEPFRGVSTKYLPNYLIWHRAVDVPLRHGFLATALRWPLVA